MERYNRQIILDEMGIEGQQKLLNAKVLIVGVGGLGSAISLYLTGAGIGTIGLIDNDIVSLTNLHRQLLYTEKEIGLSKVERASERLNTINSGIKINTYNDKLTSENVSEIFSDYDIIVDGVDNAYTRYLIDNECKKQNKPYIYGGVCEYVCQVSIFNYKNKVSYSDIFPIINENDNKIYGLFGVLPGITGILEANEVIKIITGIGDVLDGKLLQYDLRTNTQEIFHFG